LLSGRVLPFFNILRISLPRMKRGRKKVTIDLAQEQRSLREERSKSTHLPFPLDVSERELGPVGSSLSSPASLFFFFFSLPAKGAGKRGRSASKRFRFPTEMGLFEMSMASNMGPCGRVDPRRVDFTLRNKSTDASLMLQCYLYYVAVWYSRSQSYPFHVLRL
jgi:hypothetical protein